MVLVPRKVRVKQETPGEYVEELRPNRAVKDAGFELVVAKEVQSRWTGHLLRAVACEWHCGRLPGGGVLGAGTLGTRLLAARLLLRLFWGYRG